MDPDLSEDQELLVESSLRFIESTCPLARVRQRSESGGEPDSEYRLRAAEMGWFSLLVPDTLGGGSVSGNGVVDCALIAQVRGALLQPIAFTGTNVVAYALAAEGNLDQQTKVLPQLMLGEESATWATMSPSGRGTPEGGVTAIVDSEGQFVLSGRKFLVQDAHRSDWVLVTAASQDGPTQFLLPRKTIGMTTRELDGLDITRRFCEVHFDRARVPTSTIVGRVGEAAPLIDRQLQLACVLTVAESIGAMDHDFEMAVQYAKDRIAFGRPIGSFQAIKHLIADTSLLLEMSKATALSAARAVGTGATDSAEVASMAKAFIGDCGVDVAQNCFQVFGGIGYTWEHDQHLYLRRLTTDALLYGDPVWHRERLTQLAGL